MLVVLAYRKNKLIICYIYIALFWVLKALYIEIEGEGGGGGGLLNHHQCAASTWMMRRQPYCTRTPPTHTSLLVERRQSDEANQCMGMIRRPWLVRGQWGNLARIPGLHPYSFSKDILGFLMTTESQDLGLMSHPKDGACWQYSVPITTLGH